MIRRSCGLAVLGLFLINGMAWAAEGGVKKSVKVSVSQVSPPVFTKVSLQPCCGAPDRYDFEDGKTQCVVRFATGRKCILKWEVENASKIEISPSSWQDSGKTFSIPQPMGDEGSFTFLNVQFAAGTIRDFTLTAANDGGTTTHKFTIRRYSCFLAGTPVLMADGSYKNIEDVKAGDRVMSWDTQEQKLVARGVIAMTQRVEDAGEGYYVVNKDLKVTPVHKFYGNGEWKQVSELKVGDTLLDPDGQPVPITSMEYVDVQATVYNLITEDPQDYYVRMGTSDVLVHNQSEGASVPDKGFAAGTKVLLADGRRVPIEKVRSGDKLISYDHPKGRYAVIQVRDTSSQKVSRCLVLNKKLKMGVNHPIFSADAKSAPKLPD
ncbi:MAG: hypothetical protein HY922_04040 [Elusimicrobia bacterium]|nr:hypothetical protein [Elusimicrobiota bacterium]